GFAFATAPTPQNASLRPPLKPRIEPGAIVLAEDFFPDEVEVRTLGSDAEAMLERDADYDHDDCSDVGGGTAEKLVDGCRYWMEVAYLDDDWFITAYMFAYGEPARAKEIDEAFQSSDIDWLDLDMSKATRQNGWHWWDTTHVGQFALLVCAGPSSPAFSEEELPDEAQWVMRSFKSWALNELVVRT
ncbi:MAG TPA: hypothetical protein VGF17_16350, partial [Phytomonospora sp.]